MLAIVSYKKFQYKFNSLKFESAGFKKDLYKLKDQEKWVVFKKPCHFIKINVLALRNDTCPNHMKRLWLKYVNIGKAFTTWRT